MAATLTLELSGTLWKFQYAEILTEVGSSVKPYFSIGHWSTPVRGTSSEIMTSLV